MGVPHPDYLSRILTRRQFVDWIAFVKLDGPLGGDRTDFHTKFLAMHLRAQASEDPVSMSDVAMPWDPPELE